MILRYLFAAMLAGSIAPAASRYDLSAALSPSDGTLQVRGVVEIAAAGGETEVRFLVNRGLEVRAASCPVCADYSFDRSKTKVFLFVPDGAPLVFRLKRPLEKGERVEFRMEYGGKLVLPPWHMGTLGPDWIELALYSAWFPFQPDKGRFTYNLTVDIDPAWRLTGSGRIDRLGEGKWRFLQDAPTMDINLMGSRGLKTHLVKVDGREVRLDEVTLPGDAAERIAQESAALTRQFAEWLGPAASDRLTIAFADRKGGGGYSRTGFVCYETAYMASLSPPEMTRALSHEIAHMWWRNAPADTWEDWLNESFAEYTALMAVRKAHGAEAFAAKLAEFRKETAGAPPIRGIARESRDAYRVLYMEGPLILHRLEQAMGEDKFRRLLHRVMDEQVRSTGRLLAIVEQSASPEVSRELDRLLTGGIS